MAKSVPTKAFLQPAKAATICTASRGEPTHLPHPPTDNMQLKLHNEYTRHQWLKG